MTGSLSSIGNTEFLCASFLAPGRYAFAISSNQNNVDYSLAWYAVIPEIGTIWMLRIAGLRLFAVGFVCKKR